MLPQRWCNDLPFSVVLTQAAEGSESLARELGAGGFHVERWPLIRLAAVPLHEIGPVLRRLAEYDWIFLPSPSAVRLVAGLMTQLEIGWPGGARAGLIGPASVAAFRECFGDAPTVDTPPHPPHDTRHLVAGLAEAGASGAIRHALVLNRPDGRTEWLEALRDKTDSVTVVTAYTAEALVQDPSPALLRHLQQSQQDGGIAWVVGAGSQVDSLSECLPQELERWARHQPMLVPHVAIRQHALERGFDHVAVYDDRRDLIERLQYLSAGHATEHVPPADSAGKEGRSVLSLDQQKSSAIPGAKQADEGATDAKVVSDQPSVAPVPSLSAPAAPVVPATASAHTPTTPSSAGRPVATSAPPAESPPASSMSPAPVTSSSSSVGSSPTPSSSASAPPSLPPSGSPPAGPPPAGRSRSGGVIWFVLLLVLIAALAGAGWWYTQQRFLSAERDGARRVQDAEARATRLEDQIKSLRESQSQLVARSATLESKVAESATQQEQLASLYDDIAKTRGDSALAEVEQSVTMASQHLELTGNVHAALLALENAEKRLGTSDQAQALGARRLILQDIERLKALPDVDLTRLAARLDDVINRVDRLPLLADANESPVAPAAPASPTPAAAGQAPAAGGADGSAAESTSAPDTSGAADTTSAAVPNAAAPSPADASTEPRKPALERIYSWIVQGGARSLAAVREEFRSLVTIRRIDKPDSLLLSPEQKRAARENLKLLLLNARLNLLNRHQSLFREDIGRAIDSIQRLTDSDQHDVKTAIATLQSLQSQPLELDLPSLAESLAAVRAARAASEKRS